MAIFNPEDNKFYCECGCGEQIHFYNRFAPGHHNRLPEARKRQARLVVENCHNPEVYKKKGKSQKRHWDSLSPAEYWERLENGILSESAKELATDARTEACRTSEFRAKMGRIVERAWAMLSPEGKEKRLKNTVQSEASRRTHTETCRTPEFRAKMSRMVVSEWAGLSPEEKAEKIKNNPWFHSQESPQSPNETEKMLQKFLEERFPGMFIPDWVGRLDIGGKHPDFWTKNGYKLVLESFGVYYHDPEYFDRLSEEELITHYKKYGYECIVDWNNSAEDVIAGWPELAGKIKEVLGSGND